jgi:hypothetical protein
MANRYWVSGSGIWDASNTANWSTTSGGAGGASVPTASDDAYFDANSGGGTITINPGAVCDFIGGNGFTGHLIFNTDWGLSTPFGPFGISIGDGATPFTITINTGFTVRMDFVRFFGITTSGNSEIIVNGVWEITGDLIINDSNTVYSEILFLGNGYIALGGKPFTYIFMRRQNYVNMKFVHDKIISSEWFIFDDGQGTTIKEMTQSGAGQLFLSFYNSQFTIETLIFSGGILLGYPSQVITIQGSNIKNAFIKDLNSSGLIKARNSIDNGNNTNVLFITAPANIGTNFEVVSNLNTNDSGIINQSLTNTNLFIENNTFDLMWREQDEDWQSETNEWNQVDNRIVITNL